MNELKINPCKCGSTKAPLMTSDDFIPTWIAECRDCNQTRHAPGYSWTYWGAIEEWNKHNPLKPKTDERK